MFKAKGNKMYTNIAIRKNRGFLVNVDSGREKDDDDDEDEKGKNKSKLSNYPSDVIEITRG